MGLVGPSKPKAHYILESFSSFLKLYSPKIKIQTQQKMRSISTLLRRRVSTAITGTPPHPLSSAHAFPPALRRLARAKNFTGIECLLNPLIQSNPTSEPHLSSVISAFAAAGMISHSLSTLSLLPSPSSLSFNSLLSSLTHHPYLHSHVPSLFLSLPQQHPSIVPDHLSYSILIKSHCKSRHALKCFPIIQEMEKKGIPVTNVTYTTVLDSLYKEKKLKEAEKLWEEMKGKVEIDVVAYNVRVMHRAGNGDVKGVLKVMEEMEGVGLKPDVFTRNYLIGCYVRNGNWKKAREVYEGMEERNCATYRVYLDGVVRKKGDLDEGLRVFGEAVKEEGKVPDLGVVRKLVEGLVKGERRRMAKRVVTGLRKKFADDFTGGWLELEKLVGLDNKEGNDDGEKDVKVGVAA